MRRPVFRHLAPALLLALAATAARAGDEGESPAARWKRVSSAFPAPSAAKAFSWEFDFLVQGNALGSASMSAEVVEHAGKPAWKLAVKANLQDQMRSEETEVVSAALVGLVGHTSDTQGPTTKELAYERQEDGSYSVKISSGDGEPATFTVSDKDVSATLANAILACRLLPAEPAVYEVSVLDNEGTSATTAVQPGRLEVKGVQNWSFQGVERQAWVVDLTKEEDKTLRMGFDPASRALLGVEFVGAPIAIAPKGIGKAAGKVDLSKAASSPQMAAVKAAIAFACADKEMLLSSIHWPSVVDHLKTQPGNEGLTEELLQQGILSQLSEQAPRGTIEPILVGMMDGLATERLGNGHTLVKFPEMFQGLKFETAEIDGVWYVVKLPDAPGGN